MTTDTEYTQEAREAAVQEMTDAIKAYVDHVEGSPAETRNHYAAYMGILGAVEDHKRRSEFAWALIRFGANRQGVIDGFKASTGEDL